MAIAAGPVLACSSVHPVFLHGLQAVGSVPMPRPRVPVPALQPLAHGLAPRLRKGIVASLHLLRTA